MRDVRNVTVGGSSEFGLPNQPHLSANDGREPAYVASICAHVILIMLHLNTTKIFFAASTSHPKERVIRWVEYASFVSLDVDDDVMLIACSVTTPPKCLFLSSSSSDKKRQSQLTNQPTN